MDNEQEQVQVQVQAQVQVRVPVRGLIGILKESIKIVLSRPKLFSKIALTFVLPFNFFILAFLLVIFISPLDINSSTPRENLNLFASKVIINFCLGILIVILYIFVIIAVVYSTACIYTDQDITFQKALSVAHKLRRQLAITIGTFMVPMSLCQFYLASQFGLIFDLLISTPSNIQFDTWISYKVVAILIFSVEIYLIIYTQLANVITVMEDISGSKAIERTNKLMKGNYGAIMVVSQVLFLCFVPIFLLARQFVGIDRNVGLGLRIACGITSMVLNPLIITYFCVAMTMLYVVCKSYHGESIDISYLNDCFDESKLNGDYVALEDEDEKIGKLDV